jgi:hypothetical protein
LIGWDLMASEIRADDLRREALRSRVVVGHRIQPYRSSIVLPVNRRRRDSLPCQKNRGGRVENGSPSRTLHLARSADEARGSPCSRGPPTRHPHQT